MGVGRSRRRGAAWIPWILLASLALATCARPVTPPSPAPPPASSSSLVDDLAERTFRFFWETAHPITGLAPDRWPTPSFSSVAAMGFGLTAYPIGAERGWVSREAARDRTLAALRFVAALPQGPESQGRAGHRGFFYHFLEPSTGLRSERVEISTVDTALLVGGALFAAGYFDREDAAEAEIRSLADSLYRRVDWGWAQDDPPLVAMGWHPESGFIEADWAGYNEGMLVYLLALGSPTHPIEPEAWEAWSRTYRVLEFQGQSYVAFAPLFGHQYSHVFVDFRGIRDAPMRRLGFDYFENSRRAALAQRAWAEANPRGWRGLGPDVWGVTACDGPADAELPYAGEARRFWTYAGRGVGADFVLDDGTIAPTGAAASLPFVPAESTAAIRAMRERYGAHLYSTYGFFDAFNPSFRFTDVTLRHGRVVAGLGWFDTDYLGIDQGPILAMLENHRSGLVWRVMRRNPHLVRGLERAGFSGGWLDAGPPARVRPPGRTTLKSQGRGPLGGFDSPP
jgi:hypothetical protein